MATQDIMAPTTTLDVSRTFPFQQLPAEMRNKIYRAALKASGPLLIRYEELSRRSIRTSKHRLSASVIGGQLLSTRPSFLGPLGAAILRTNRSIYAEAMPILYHANEFRFITQTYINEFLNDYWKGSEHLRSITIEINGDNDWPHYRLPVQKLAKASVEELVFDIGATHISIDHQVEHLVKILSGFIKCGGGEDECRQQFQKVRIKLYEQFYFDAYPRASGTVNGMSEQFQTAVEAEAAMLERIEQRFIEQKVLPAR